MARNLACRWVPSDARIGIDPDLFSRIDIDLQFSPANKIDGPSAGITIFTAICTTATVNSRMRVSFTYLLYVREDGSAREDAGTSPSRKPRRGGEPN